MSADVSSGRRRRQASSGPLSGWSNSEEPHRRSLCGRWPGPITQIIAECKKASPSAGVIREKFDPVHLAQAYAAGHAAAISVVTERDSFAGDPLWLIDVRKAVDLPVLRKDFIIERRQLFESALLGADAVLLISRILSQQRLKDLLSTAEMLQLEVLLEIFADEDPGPAVDSGAAIIGVNARDLATFEIRLDRVEAAGRKDPRRSDQGCGKRNHRSQRH